MYNKHYIKLKIMNTQIKNIINIAEFATSCKVEDTDSITAFLNELLNNPYRDKDPSSTLQQLNELTQSHGVETVDDEKIAEAIHDCVAQFREGNAIAYYLNTGDSYNLTVIYDFVTEEYLITTIADYIEFCDKLKYVAAEVEIFALGIHWSDWEEEDGESYFPIRLRVFENQLTPCFGDPSFDSDHRGVFASAQLVPEMKPWDYLETVISMLRDMKKQ